MLSLSAVEQACIPGLALHLDFVTEEEEEAILSAFRVFDKENTGRIDADELRHIFVTLGDALTQEEVNYCHSPDFPAMR